MIPCRVLVSCHISGLVMSRLGVMHYVSPVDNESFQIWAGNTLIFRHFPVPFSLLHFKKLIYIIEILEVLSNNKTT
jgi:hypothetical protein